MEINTVNINVNGADFKVKAGLNVIDACKSVGIEIPHFCYHEYLSIAGSCRLCLVTTGTPARDRATGDILKNEDGTQKIAWAPKPAIACGTKVSEGLHVITNSKEIENCRKGVMEFLLVNHPLDCPICDKAGECSLQEYAVAYGTGESRYAEPKNAKPKHEDIAGKVVLDAERCILCSRCIRISNEVMGKSVFGFTKRGSKTEIAVYPGEATDSEYLLNVVDNCPVGALTEKAFRFKMRTWFLKRVKSISPESSAGVNTCVWSRENVIYRITPRNNPQVNDAWMCDTGRYAFKKYAQETRISQARIDSSVCETSYAVKRATEILKLSGVVIVANARQTLEEMFALSRLAKSLKAEIHMVSHLRASDDGKLLSADETPNMRGAFVTGLVSEYPKADFAGLAAKVRAGEIGTILCFGEDLLKLGLEEKDFKAANVIYCGALENASSKASKICIPLSTVFEKGGLWINRQFRLQEFEKAIAAPDGVIDSVNLLFELQRSYLGESFKNPSLQELRALMASEITALPAGGKPAAQGTLIDAAPYAGVKFPESNALHFTKNV